MKQLPSSVRGHCFGPASEVFTSRHANAEGSTKCWPVAHACAASDHFIDAILLPSGGDRSSGIRSLVVPAAGWPVDSSRHQSDGKSSSGGGAISSPSNPHVDSGRKLAERWCVVCHLLPQPGDLPRERWPFMMKWMGIYLGHPNSGDDIKNLIYPSLVPTHPAVTPEELQAIEDYYVATAPPQIEPAFPRHKRLPITAIFKPEPWPGYARPVTVSLVKIDSDRQRLYLGGGSGHRSFVRRRWKTDKQDQLQSESRGRRATYDGRIRLGAHRKSQQRRKARHRAQNYRNGIASRAFAGHADRRRFLSNERRGVGRSRCGWPRRCRDGRLW